MGLKLRMTMKTTVEQILHRKQRVVFYWLSAAIIVGHMLRETQTNEVIGFIFGGRH